MDSKSGMSLYELMIVVVIVGILATLAIPRYIKLTETIKVREAISSLKEIREGEIIYRNEENTYWASPTTGTAIEKIRSINDNLRVYLDVRDNRNWNYDVLYPLPSSSGTVLSATATRRGGRQAGQSIDMNEQGTLDFSNWTGPRP